MTIVRRLRNRRRVLVAATVVGTLGGVVWIAFSSPEAAGIVAGAAALLFAGSALLLDLIDFFRSGPAQAHIAEIADKLSVAVATQWRVEADSRGLRDASVLPLRWAASRRHVDDTLVAVADGSAIRPTRLNLTGGMSDEFETAILGLAREYQKVPSGRLVLLGEPGAGKTVLALLLTLGLLQERQAGGRVPVLLSVSDWDPVLDELEAWLVRTIAMGYYNGQLDAPRELFRSGLILPVLDGLDEIPESSRRVAIAKINKAIRRERPVVVTCRSNEYEDSILDGSPALSRAPVIELEPISVEELESYFAGLDWRPGITWRPVLNRMRRHPQGPVALALSTPLTVSLARLVYQRLPDLPTELLDEDVYDSRHAIEDSLTARVVPAAYADVDGEQPGKRFPVHAVQAERYLTQLAKYLHRHRERDFRWWLLSDRELSTWAGPTLGILAGLTVMIAVAAWVSWLAGENNATDATVTFGAWAGAAYAVLVTIVWFAGAGRRPGRLSFRTTGSVSRLRSGFRTGTRAVAIPAIAVLVGFAITITITGTWAIQNIERFAQAVCAAAALAGMTGLTVAAQRWLDAADRSASPIDPQKSVRHDRNLSIVAACTAGLIFGVLLIPTVIGGMWAGSIAENVLSRWSGWPGETEVLLTLRARAFDVLQRYFASIGAAIAAMALLPAVGILGLTLLTKAWPRYVIVNAVLATRRQLPFRLSRFLADAQARGVLRGSAGTYQFRHVRLQEQLATRDAPSQSAAVGANPSRVLADRFRLPVKLAAAAAGILLATAGISGIVPTNEARFTLHGSYASAVLTAMQGQFPDAGGYRFLFSPSGNRIALTSPAEPVVHVFSTENAAPEAEIRFRGAVVEQDGIVFSPSADKIAVNVAVFDPVTLKSRRTVGVWALPGGQWIRTFDLSPDSSNSEVEFSANGRYLVLDLRSNDESVQKNVIWDIGNRRKVDEFVDSRVQLPGDSLADFFIVTSDSADAQLRRLSTGGLIASLPGTAVAEDEDDVSYTQDDTKVMSYSRKRGVRIWNATSGDVVASLGRVASYTSDVVVDEDRDRAFVANLDGVIRVWDTSEWKMIASTTATPGSLLGIHLHPTRELMVSLDDKGVLHQWDWSGRSVASIDVGLAARRPSYHLTSDGASIVVTDEKAQISKIFPTADMGAAVTVSWRGLQEGPVLHERETLAFASARGDYHFFRTSDGTPFFQLNDISPGVNNVLPADRVAVRVSADEVGIHSTDDGRRINTIPASSAMDPVSLGKHFASFPSNGVIDIRHSSTGDCIARLTGHAGPLSEVGLSPDGDLLASSSSDGTVRLWQLPEETATSTC